MGRAGQLEPITRIADLASHFQIPPKSIERSFSSVDCAKRSPIPARPLSLALVLVLGPLISPLASSLNATQYQVFMMKAGKSKSDTSKKADAKLSVKRKAAEKATAKKPAVKKAKAGKDPNKPKRPPSAFFIFMEEFRKQFKEKNPNNKLVSVVGKAAGDKWKSMSAADKAPYEAKAAKRKAEYNKTMVAYNKKLSDGGGKKSVDEEEEEEESDKSKSEVHDDDEDDESGEDEEDEDDDE